MQNETKFANLENSLQAIINQAKTDYESNLISKFSNNSSKIYKYIRSLKKL